MGWYNANWQYRVKVTTDHTKVTADQSNYTAYLNLASLPAGFWSHVKADGSDIVVTASDGTTKINRELVSLITRPSITNITKDGTSTGATSFTTGNFQGPTNKLILASFASRTGISTDPNEPTCTGWGLTWVKVNTVVYDNTSSSRKRVTTFRALGTPSYGAITFDCGGQTQTHGEWTVDYFSNADTSGTNGSGAIVQSVTNFDGSATVATITGTLAAFGSANNGTYGVFAEGSSQTWTAGSGFAINSQDKVSTAISIMSEFRNDNDTTVDASVPSNTEIGVIAIEIKTALSGELHFGTTTLHTGSNDDFYIYYGYAGASETNSTSTWDSSFRGVWHLQQDPAGSAPQALDSTAGATHLTSVASPTLVDAELYKGWQFNYDNHQWATNASASSNLYITGTLTLECWFQTSDLTSTHDQGFINMWRTGGTQGNYYLYLYGPNKIVYFYSDGTYGQGSSAVFDTLNTTYYVGFSLTDGASGSYNYYKNGAAAGNGSGNYTALPTSNDSSFWIATRNGNNSEGLKGWLDEVRVSNVIRPATYFSTTYNMINANNTFWGTIGSEETAGTTTSQTILGQSRLTVATLQTILGKARLTVSTAQTILGKSRIGLITAQTILGKSRIGLVTSKTITGLSRITASTSQTILGKSRIGLVTAQTILGKSRIGLITTKTIQGMSRITAPATKTILGLARVTAVSTQTILGKSRIGLITSKTIQGLARIGLLTSQTILGKSRITAATLQTILGRASISAGSAPQRTITGMASISSTTSSNPKFIYVKGKLHMRLFGKHYQRI